MARRSSSAGSFSVAHVALILPWITAVVAARLPIKDNSFLWHVTAGRLQIDDGAVLTTDPFSFTRGGEAWRTQSWLLELLYGFFDVRSGLAFVTPFIALSASLVFALVLVVTYRRTRSVAATAIVGVMTAWLSAAFLSPRPVLVSYLMLALVIAASVEKRMRWTLPLIAFVWAAVHGSFILGIGYVVLMGLWRRDRRAAIDALAMTVAATLTAHGWGVWQVLVDFARSQDSLDLITEWATPDLTKLALIPFLAGIVLLIIAGICQNLSMRDLWIVVPFLIFSTTATRAVFPAWVVLAPFAGAAFASVRASSRSGQRERRILTGITALLVVFPIVLPVEGGSALSEDFPAAAVETLTAERVFHDDFAGGYLIYRYGTERPVFIDDRAELYGADHLRAMIEARNGVPEWRDVFDEWSIEEALVRGDSGLAAVLEGENWIAEYRDDEYVVFSRPA